MINQYSQEIIEYIEAIQKPYLIARFGIGFESKLSEIFGNNDKLFDFIENQLENEFGNNYDSRYELEALLKTEALNNIPNLTRFEFPTHKRLLNFAENIFSFAIKDIFEEKIPYSATLFSNKVNAEIKPFENLDKPIIFFHGELFIANLLLCKLFVQLIPYELPSNTDILRFRTDKEFIFAKLDLVTPRVIDFFNKYFSNSSIEIYQYSLNSQIENKILYLLLESVLLFIFSHEVAHYSYSHLVNENKTKEEKWNEEFEADLYAINRVINLYRKNNNPSPFTLIAPVIFFKYLILIEKYKPEIKNENSHPPSIKRLEYYYIHLFNLTNEDEEDIIKEYLMLEDNISTILLEVFDNISNKNY